MLADLFEPPITRRRRPALHEPANAERQAAGLHRRHRLDLLLPVPPHPLRGDPARRDLGQRGRVARGRRRRPRARADRAPSPRPSPSSRSTRTSCGASARSDENGRVRTRCYTPGRAQEPRHRRIACQGAHHRALSRCGLPRPGVLRTRPRPAGEPRQGQVRRRRRPRLRTGVRDLGRPPQAGLRHREGRQGRRPGLPRHRPRPRGRGHRLARRRGRPRPGDEDAPGHLQRDHRVGDPRGVRATRARSTWTSSTRSRRAASSIASSATRSARCCRGRSAAACRPVASSRSPSGSSSSASARSLGFTAREYWTIEALLATDGRRALRRRARADRRRSARRQRTRRPPSAIEPPSEPPRRRHQGRDADPEAVAGAPVHDLDAPAGGQPQPGLQPEADDVDRPAAVRGDRDRRGPGRPDHLHANRLDRDRRRGHGRGARGHRRALRPGVHDAQGPRLQDEVEGRPGGPRVDPPDELPRATRIRWPARSSPTSCGSTG